jgi:Protein of unknown function (DUF4012)
LTYSQAPDNLTRLRGLRTQPQRSKWLKVGRGGVGNKFTNQLVTIITILLITTVSIATLCSRISQSYDRAINKQDILLATLQELWTVVPSLEESIAESLSAEVKSILAPVNDFVGSEWLMNYELNRLYEQMYNWKSVLAPLQQFSLTSKGFTNGLSKATFTVVLEQVLGDIETTLNSTKSYYRSLLLYRLLGSFSPRIQKLMNTISTLFKLIDIVIEEQNSLLTLLGHYSSQSIVILNQNPGESRPTGGFPGSYLELSVTQGELNIKESQSIYWVSNNVPSRVVAHPITWNYNYNDAPQAHNIHNLNFFPCFKDTAKLFTQEFVRSENGFTINQFYMITPELLEDLLPDDLILKVDGVGALNKTNLLNVIERITSIEVKDVRNPKEQIAAIFGSILNNLPAIIANKGTRGLVDTFINAVATRSLQLWYPNTKLNEFMNTLGFHSDQLCADKNPNSLGLVTANVSGDKRSLVAKHYLGISAQPGFGSTKITLNYTQYLSDVQSLQRYFNNKFPVDFFGFQLPAQAKNITIKSDDILSIEALRKYYYVDLDQDGAGPYQTPQVLQQVVAGSYDLENGGIVYPNPDGSVLAGAYLNDEIGATDMIVTFEMPHDITQNLTIYPQPGMKEATLYLGDNTAISTAPYQRSSNGNEFKKGIPLKIR